MAPETPLLADYARVRARTLALCETLEPEDTVVQSMPDVSPTKWHLAHVTWFFERFVLEHFVPDYTRFEDVFDYLFNSYYYSVGQMHSRPMRGLITRPTLAEVIAYRSRIDDAMASLLEARDDEPELREEVSNFMEQKLEELRMEIKEYVNERVNKFSQVHTVVLQTAPFQKTATQKIKRFLYH